MSDVKWSSTRYKLRLKVVVDLKKYEDGDLVLPPVQLGICKKWRFEIEPDEYYAIFSATWERRMLPVDINIEDITSTIQPYVYDPESIESTLSSS